MPLGENVRPAAGAAAREAIPGGVLDFRRPTPQEAVKYRMQARPRKTRQRSGSRSGWTRTIAAVSRGRREFLELAIGDAGSSEWCGRYR